MPDTHPGAQGQLKDALPKTQYRPSPRGDAQASVFELSGCCVTAGSKTPLPLRLSTNK